MVSIEEDFEEGQWPFGGDGDFDEVPVPVDSLPSAPGLFSDDVGRYRFRSFRNKLKD
ncbi:hypothetical protein PPTG_23500 [Phytophthora nicotianae INRA-310]|uniref:Uncharacterized protein n=1 Tax=Phytophthora nicotianae (strain INRA-310) TaxID=761204 RepID=W2PXJ7_PHYN3|nr:hypothetical protein PPTG_23500 [Phytophthora nicotianae INRA-310]ETN05341.1 hypothetical protein PPTG_23500 [Phytophthora nicotianae INRA-310]